MRLLRCLLMIGVPLAAACGDPFALPRPAFENVVDSTVSLYALSGTPPRTPSGYFMQFRETVLVQNGGTFDFAIDLDSLSRPVLMPTGALKLGRSSGVQKTALAFDSIHIAPGTPFQQDSGVVVNVGERAIVHSRDATCSFGIAAVYYGKLVILAVDTAARRIDFRILVNTNCGYRGLDPGLPAR